MVLLRLNLHGFKSFADPVEVQFPGRIVGVIGPNGCGKSNIVDAVRFVLGEQSLRLLRARKIDDLIFAGNIRRPATSMGEVGLTLDNSTRWLDIDYPEVEIRRMIQRDGESRYFLNGAAVRLKDIQKMFMDVGVNKGHYSVIGQGQVQMIVSASPEERRQYFEEAAGIVSYRQSKKETLRRLDEVQKNMEQAGVFASEYESRMHGLKVQAGRAQKYLEYQTAYRELYLFTAYRRYHGIRREVDDIAQQADSHKADLLRLEESAADWSAKETGLTQGRAGLTEELAAAELSLREAERLCAERDKAQAALEEKTYSLKRARNDIDFSALKLSRSLMDMRGGTPEETQDLAALLADLNKELTVSVEHAEHETDLLRSELQSTESKLQAEEARMDVSRADVLSAHEALAALESSLSAQQSAAGEQQARIDALSGQLSADDAQLAALTAELETHERRRADYGQTQTVAELSVKEAEARMDQSREKLNQLRRGMAEVEGRYRSLSAAEESYQGFSTSVRLVLERFDKRDELLGAVRDLMAFDAPYAKAVEAALGPKLQHLVVGTGETVKEILNEIKGDLRGRVTFWALDLLPAPVAAPELPWQEDWVGWAVKLLRFDDRLRRLFENLLGRTLVVRDMEALLSAAKLHRGIAIVTLEGAYCRSGAITAGPTAGAILMGRKQELCETESRLKELIDLIAAEEQAHARACSEVVAARSAIEAAYRRYKEADAEHARVSAAAESLARMAEDRRQRLTAESDQLAQRTSAIAGLQSEQARLRETERILPASFRELLEDLRRQVQSLRGDMESAVESLRSAQEKMRECVRIDAESQDLTRRRAESEQEQQALDTQAAVLCQELQEARGRADAQAASVKGMAAELGRISGEIEAARSSAAQCRAEQQSRRDAVHQMELRWTALDAERNNLRENALNEMQTDLETLPEAPAPPADWNPDTSATGVSAADRLKDLQFKMQKIGAVNVHAIEEYNEVAAKHEELAKQLTDLTLARDNLKETLRRTDRVCRDRFADVFHRVAAHFQDVTKKLFLGGEGKLILTESEDMMESGVDIQLRPPGKGFTSIASRSGGEQSLAGLCLLFSLFMEKPSPFCILDEVDAALDDVNVGRLARLIEEFSEKIQFVIVTHNKVTMQIANCLFGATMEEAGITKLISVRMKRAQEAALAASA
ncbi:MAG: chromosome segregation protein SMC [Candidatus Lindowbacteria bacterium RIFCSPLOWO2_12_FULL_62_27]|nr:MAG: chromosome segregation protein SMC [Candidatus Lindowbacteria bacterium RIFCSPLOWO2_02_FULL_62_12]OGH62501.1 MAG: chromosome segregation protein SMC [Candidatus Lindowbacteria bacterium RIFCSPLOWO2_12_FULL_62_27]